MTKTKPQKPVRARRASARSVPRPPEESSDKLSDNLSDKPFDLMAFGKAWHAAMEKAAPVLAQATARAISGVTEETAGERPIDPLRISKAMAEYWAHYARHPSRLVELQMKYAEDMGHLWQESLRKFAGEQGAAQVAPADPALDRRFRDPAWRENAAFDFLRQSYMLTRKTIEESLKQAHHLPGHDRQKLEFYTRLYLDALSPNNFALTNPEVIRETVRSGGENLIKGLHNLVTDLKRGGGDLKISTTNPRAFKVGENLATTAGQVVFKNKMMELIQYAPSTPTVHKIPLVVIPPWINKYYILDLRPENSFVKFAVDQGFTVFMVSWANPDASYANVKFDDYLTQGALAALDVVEQITGQKTTNVMGYCIGGTLAAMLLVYLARKKKSSRVASATMLTTLIDFSHAGDMKVFIDDAQIDALEERMRKHGYLDAMALQKTFSVLRANDMIWSFVVNNYMLGREPFPFDILYWNDDSTNLPAAFHAYYLRHMYLHNDLVKPNKLTIAGVKMDMSVIKTPLYFLSTREDHIAPWVATYAGAEMISRSNPQVRFTLAESGHVAGVVNPAGAKKYGHWTANVDTRRVGRALPERHQDWLDATTYHEGSWWPDWAKWTGARSGGRTAPPPMGSAKYPPTEPAPGSYVKKKT